MIPADGNYDFFFKPRSIAVIGLFEGEQDSDGNVYVKIWEWK